MFEGKGQKSNCGPDLNSVDDQVPKGKYILHQIPPRMAYTVAQLALTRWAWENLTVLRLCMYDRCACPMTFQYNNFGHETDSDAMAYAKLLSFHP